MKLLVATGNAGKVREFAHLLASLPLELVSLRDAGITTEVPETGDTFSENALLKARGYAALSGLLTLAEDSGLEVDALDGAPGVLSARYGGPDLDDRGRYELVLHRLAGVPDERRTARFCSVIAVATPDGRQLLASGACEGRITHAPRGANGFGYDPIFEIVAEGRTTAEMPQEHKNAISHRAVATRAILPQLRQLLTHNAP